KVTTPIVVPTITNQVSSETAIGVVTLRFMAGLFIRWLDEFVNLEDAGYITVALVGLRLLAKVFNEAFVPPQWLMVSIIAVILAWGFSKRNVSELTKTSEHNEAYKEIKGQ
ncbi:MAG: hypothetical protein AAFX80_16815, partial [Cyanobacteria bacterium J06639_18]